MENPLQRYKHLIGELEQASNTMAQKYDIEHLSGPQGKVLYYLYKHQEDTIFVKDIERWLGISKSVTSHLVKRMEKNGFIRLENVPHDKRYKRLLLTPDGITKIAPLEAFHQEMMQVLFAGISDDDQLAVERLSCQLQQNLSHFKQQNSSTD